MPLTVRTDHDEPSLFRPENLLATARRHKSLEPGAVPPICILDPDGDLVRHLRRTDACRRSQSWACFHTELWEFDCEGLVFGLVGFTVGGPFAVMVAEQLFASGCRLLLSIGSAGQVAREQPPPYFMLIRRALRDEGASHHYLPAADYAEADTTLLLMAERALARCAVPIVIGDSWTTDAPYRETQTSLDAAQARGLLAVEMEAASLYAFATARRRAVLCLAQVTNCLAQRDTDFQKGEHDGAPHALALLAAIGRAWTRDCGAPQLSHEYA